MRHSEDCATFDFDPDAQLGPDKPCACPNGYEEPDDATRSVRVTPIKIDLPPDWNGHHEPDDRGPEDLPPAGQCTNEASLPSVSTDRQRREDLDQAHREGWRHGLRDALSECEVVLTQDPKHLEQVGYTRSRIQAVYDGKRVGQGDPDEQRTNEAVPQLRGGVLLDSGAFITTAEIEEIRRKCPEAFHD